MFIGEAVHGMKAGDERACITREISKDRKDLGLEFKNLPPSGKIKYISQSHKVEKVADEETTLLVNHDGAWVNKLILSSGQLLGGNVTE
ncbi:hypothetical protein AB3S75_042937 [Citrus x aurantiifolia]